jgi:hypothetical protein
MQKNMFHKTAKVTWCCSSMIDVVLSFLCLYFALYCRVQPKWPVNSLTRTLFFSRHILILSSHAPFHSKWSLCNVSTMITAHHTALFIMLYTMSRGNGQEKTCFVFHSNVCGRKRSVRVRWQQATLAAHDDILVFVKAVSPSFFLLPSPSSMTLLPAYSLYTRTSHNLRPHEMPL